MAPPLQKRERVGEKSPRKAYINVSPVAPYRNYPMALNLITQVPIVPGGLPGRRPFQPETRAPCCRTALLAGVLARAPMGPAPVPATGASYVGVPRGGVPKGAAVGVGAGFQRLRPASHSGSRASGGVARPLARHIPPPKRRASRRRSVCWGLWWGLTLGHSPQRGVTPHAPPCWGVAGRQPHIALLADGWSVAELPP